MNKYCHYPPSLPPSPSLPVAQMCFVRILTILRMKRSTSRLGRTSWVRGLGQTPATPRKAARSLRKRVRKVRRGCGQWWAWHVNPPCADEEGDENKMEISDQTGSKERSLRRQIYLTIMSSLGVEECAHKLLKGMSEGQEVSCPH